MGRKNRQKRKRAGDQGTVPHNPLAVYPDSDDSDAAEGICVPVQKSSTVSFDEEETTKPCLTKSTAGAPKQKKSKKDKAERKKKNLEWKNFHRKV